LISRVTDAVMEDARAWQTRPLDDVYPVVFLDALVLRIRDGGSGQRKACELALAITMDGERDVLGLWFQDTEGAKFWMQVLSDLQSRGLRDILICLCRRARRLPGGGLWRSTRRRSCRPASCTCSARACATPRATGYGQVVKDLRPISTAVDADAAQAALEAFEEKWATSCP
jgi:putative transposase